MTSKGGDHLWYIWDPLMVPNITYNGADDDHNTKELQPSERRDAITFRSWDQFRCWPWTGIDSNKTGSKASIGAGKRAQWLRALAVFSDDLSLIKRTQKMVHNCLYSIPQGSNDHLHLLWETYINKMHMQAKHLHIKQIYIFKLN